jgi:hypothetical protein
VIGKTVQFARARRKRLPRALSDCNTDPESRLVRAPSMDGEKTWTLESFGLGFLPRNSEPLQSVSEEPAARAAGSFVAHRACRGARGKSDTCVGFDRELAGVGLEGRGEGMNASQRRGKKGVRCAKRLRRDL